MDAGINNVTYMELHSGPKMVNGTCGKTIVAGMIDRGFTVVLWALKIEEFVKLYVSLTVIFTALLIIFASQLQSISHNAKCLFFMVLNEEYCTP
jgi:hypothetical protein